MLRIIVAGMLLLLGACTGLTTPGSTNGVAGLVTKGLAVQQNIQTQAVAPIAGAIAADATNAAAMTVTDKINPQAAALRTPCYQNVTNLAGGLANAKAGGLITGVEASLEGSELFQNANCQAVGGQVLVNLIQAGQAGIAGAALPAAGAAVLAAPAGL